MLPCRRFSREHRRPRYLLERVLGRGLAALPRCREIYREPRKPHSAGRRNGFRDDDHHDPAEEDRQQRYPEDRIRFAGDDPCRRVHQRLNKPGGLRLMHALRLASELHRHVAIFGGRPRELSDRR